MKLMGAMTPSQMYLLTDSGLIKPIIADEAGLNDNALPYSIPVAQWSVDQNFDLYRQTYRTLDGSGPVLTRGNTHVNVNAGIATGFDIGNVFREISVLRGDVDARDETGVYAQLAAAIGYGDNGVPGAALDRIRLAGATNLDPTLQQHKGVQMTARIGEWAVNHMPAANTRATITKAAVAGARHVCTGLICSMAMGGASLAVGTMRSWRLRDGASGAGTVLIGGYATETVQKTLVYQLANLNIVGSVNTAMTLEFDIAAGVDNYQSVALTGYTISD